MRQRMKPWLAGLMLVLAIGLVPGLAIAEGGADGAAAPDADVATAVADQAADAAADTAPDATPAEDPSDADKAQAQEPEGGKQDADTTPKADAGDELKAQDAHDDDPWDYDADVTDLGIGEELELDANTDFRYFAFTPEENGLYRIYSMDADDADIDPFIQMMVEGEIQYNDDCDDGLDFSLEATLEAGTEYLFRVAARGNEGTYRIAIEATEAVKVKDGAYLVYGDGRFGDWDDDDDNPVFSFDRYSVEDLLEVADSYYIEDLSVNADGWEETGVVMVAVDTESESFEVEIPVVSYAQDHSSDPELVLGQPQSLDLADASRVFYRFAPDEAMKYQFKTQSAATYDPYIRIYDSNGYQIGSHNDDFEDVDYQKYLEADAVYFVCVGCYEDDMEEGEFTFSVTPYDGVSKLQATVVDGASLVYGEPTNGYWYDDDGYRFSDWALFNALKVVATIGQQEMVVSDVDDLDYIEADTASWEKTGKITVRLAYEEVEASVEVPVKSLASAYANVPKVVEGKATTVNASKAGQRFTFTPSTTGKYRFIASATGIDENDEAVAYLNVFDANGEVDRDFDDRLFNSWVELKAKTTYYLYAEALDISSYSFTVSKIPALTSFKATLRPGSFLVQDDEAYGWYDDEDGFVFNQSAVLRAIDIAATFEDGSSDAFTRGELDSMVSLGMPEKWVVGNNKVTLSLDGKKATVNVPVKSRAEALKTAATLSEFTAVKAIPMKYFRFVPAESGWYRFMSFDQSKGMDPKAYLYDESGSRLGTNDDGGSGCNFNLGYELEAGKTYYYLAGQYGNDSGEYYVKVKPSKELKSISATVKQGTYLVYGGVSDGYWNDETGSAKHFYFYPDRVFATLNVSGVYEDGREDGNLLYSEIEDVSYENTAFPNGGTLKVTLWATDDSKKSVVVNVPVKTIAQDAAIKEAAIAAAKAEADIANGKVSLAKSKYTFTGKGITPAVTVKSKSGKMLKQGVDYSVAYSSNLNAGVATVTISGKGAYNGKATATFTIAKAANPMKVKAKAVKAKAKKKTTVKAAKAFAVSNAKGKLIYKVVKADKKAKKKITVSKAGKVTVKKGLKKGTYKVKVKITAAGDANYNSASKTVTLKVKVK